MNVTVSSHTTALEAHIVRGRLECEGIQAFVAFEHHVWAQWHLSLALGGVQVQVPAEQLEAAVRVIKDIEAGKFLDEPETEDAEPAPRCPKCHYGTPKRVDWPSRIALLGLFVVQLPIPYTHHRFRCDFCSHRWLASEQRGYPLYVPLFAFVAMTVLMLFVYELWCHWCRLYCARPLCG